jgi:serine/threonine protein kinase
VFRFVGYSDLKPENYVFETEDDTAEMKLIDFGCAKLVKDDEVYRDMAGTPYVCCVC